MLSTCCCRPLSTHLSSLWSYSWFYVCIILFCTYSHEGVGGLLLLLFCIMWLMNTFCLSLTRFTAHCWHCEHELASEKSKILCVFLIKFVYLSLLLLLSSFHNFIASHIFPTLPITLDSRERIFFILFIHYVIFMPASIPAYNASFCGEQ